VRGAGLARVQNAVKVRQGDSVTLVLETTNESKAKAVKAVSACTQLPCSALLIICVLQPMTLFEHTGTV
jgi:hypothetical protein